MLIEKAGSVVVDVSYLVAGASWYPELAVDVRRDGDTMSVQSLGLVQQATGEPWDNVVVTLSTQRPWSGPQPLVALQAREGSDEHKRAVTRVTTNLSSGSSAFREIAFRGGQFELTAVAPMSVPVDGSATVVVASEASLTATKQYAVVPATNAGVRVRCEAVNTSGQPLLPGPVYVLYDGRLVEKSTVSFVDKDEKLHFEMTGSDEASAVRALDYGASSVSEDGGQVRLTLAYVMTVTTKVAGSKAAVTTVELTDRIPTVANGATAVRIVNAVPRPKQTDDGALVWRLSTKPGGTATARLMFQLVYQKGAAPAGVAELERQVRETLADGNG